MISSLFHQLCPPTLHFQDNEDTPYVVIVVVVVCVAIAGVIAIVLVQRQRAVVKLKVRRTEATGILKLLGRHTCLSAHMC